MISLIPLLIYVFVVMVLKVLIISYFYVLCLLLKEQPLASSIIEILQIYNLNHLVKPIKPIWAPNYKFR